MLKAYNPSELVSVLDKSKATIFRRMKQYRLVPVSFTKRKKEIIRRLLKSDLNDCVLSLSNEDDSTSSRDNS